MTIAVQPPRALSDARAYRLSNIDMLRGLVIVIMALDHVRDYVMLGALQDPTTDPDVGAAVFFTRWITHFCAPAFVFLAGTSAGLMAARKSRPALGRFLLTRGIWLVLIEWFVIATAWSFAPWGIAEIGGRVAVPMQVIWAIGASMVVLAGAQLLGRRACLLIGAAVLVGHNLLDPAWPAASGLERPRAVCLLRGAPLSDSRSRDSARRGPGVRGTAAPDGHLLFSEGLRHRAAGRLHVWILVVAALYPLCCWMAALKARRRDWWLSYV